MAMPMPRCSSLSKNSLLFIFVSSILLLQPLGSWAANQIQFHNGHVLSGKIDLSILWYGRFGKSQKNVLRQFIQSLNHKSGADPQVSTWWKMVEQYQSIFPTIKVGIVKEEIDRGYSVGKTLTQASIKSLIQKITQGAPSSVALVFSDKEVLIDGTCNGKCTRHGFVDMGRSKTLYMVVGHPETKCPNECGWPFNRPNSSPHTLILPLQPPNGNVGTDSMVIGLATALAQTVSNPFNNGYFGGSASNPIEVVSACPKIFGSGAFAGYMGKVRIIPGNSGCYNAHGVKGSKFLLPALWNPNTHSCWTLI